MTSSFHSPGYHRKINEYREEGARDFELRIANCELPEGSRRRLRARDCELRIIVERGCDLGMPTALTVRLAIESLITDETRGATLNELRPSLCLLLHRDIKCYCECRISKCASLGFLVNPQSAIRNPFSHRFQWPCSVFGYPASARQTIRFELPVKSAWRDSKNLGSLALVPAGLLQNADNLFLL